MAQTLEKLFLTKIAAMPKGSVFSFAPKGPFFARYTSASVQLRLSIENMAVAAGVGKLIVDLLGTILYSLNARNHTVLPRFLLGGG